jgi:serine/threonine protein phosphatase 1
VNNAIFAIGDIHGQLGFMEQALEFVAQDACAGAPIVFLGDYVDRGPDSRGVIDLLLQGQAEGRNWHFLLGNHEDFFLRFLRAPSEINPHTRHKITWLADAAGGRATLASYGVDVDPRRSHEDICADAHEAVPQAHLEFLRSLPRRYQTRDHLFVHAGIRPGIALEDQNPEDLIWIRQEFLQDRRDHGPLVVHGHTPVDLPEHNGNRVNCDGGAGFGRPIHPVLLLGRDAFLLGRFGRSQLQPLPGVVL